MKKNYQLIHYRSIFNSKNKLTKTTTKKDTSNHKLIYNLMLK